MGTQQRPDIPQATRPTFADPLEKRRDTEMSAIYLRSEELIKMYKYLQALCRSDHVPLLESRGPKDENWQDLSLFDDCSKFLEVKLETHDDLLTARQKIRHRILKLLTILEAYGLSKLETTDDCKFPYMMISIGDCRNAMERLITENS